MLPKTKALEILTLTLKQGFFTMPTAAQPLKKRCPKGLKAFLGKNRLKLPLNKFFFHFVPIRRLLRPLRPWFGKP